MHGFVGGKTWRNIQPTGVLRVDVRGRNASHGALHTMSLYNHCKSKADCVACLLQKWEETSSRDYAIMLMAAGRCEFKTLGSNWMLYKLCSLQWGSMYTRGLTPNIKSSYPPPYSGITRGSHVLKLHMLFLMHLYYKIHGFLICVPPHIVFGTISQVWK